MALPNDLMTREYQKFDVNDSGQTIVRTSVSGTLTPSGLKTGGLITEVTLNSTTWTAIPATPLSGRNAIGIQNRSGIEIKINYSSAVVGYVGVVVPTGGERYYDITDQIVLYAKSTSGTPTITIEEIA